MVRALIIPKTASIHLEIPQDYVGAKVEVLIFKEDEGKSGNVEPTGIARLRGSVKLTPEQSASLEKHLKDIRAERDREF